MISLSQLIAKINKFITDTDKGLSDEIATRKSERVKITDEIDTKVKQAINNINAQKGVAGGIPVLGNNGKIDPEYLPAYVDQVESYPSSSAFPRPGSDKVIYVAEDTGNTYRWSGRAYISMNAETSTAEHALRADKMTNKRKINEVDFDGTEDITIYDKTKVSKYGDVMTGNLTVPKINDKTIGNESGWGTIPYSDPQGETRLGNKITLSTQSDPAKATKSSITIQADGSLTIPNINGNLKGNAATATEAAHAAKATKTEGNAPNGGTADLVNGWMAANDAFRIRVGGANNNGWAEIATADDGTEPIHIRQYDCSKGDSFSQLIHSATILDESGNSSFPGVVNAPRFKGEFEGHATSATNDGNNKVISDEYLHRSGGVMTGKITLPMATDGTWKSGKTNAAFIWSPVGKRDGSKYDPIMWGKDTENNVWNFGWHAAGGIGFLGYTASQTANPGNNDMPAGSLIFDPKNGITSGIFHGDFTGPLHGNADTVSQMKELPVGTDNGSRPVWFSWNGNNPKPVMNSKFQYNPATDTLTVGNVTGTANNANHLGGLPLRPVGGTGGHYNTVPFVGPDGVMEIGKYIDWHQANGGTEDFSSRWTAESNGTVSIGTINGTLNGNASSATKAVNDNAGREFTRGYLYRNNGVVSDISAVWTEGIYTYSDTTKNNPSGGWGRLVVLNQNFNDSKGWVYQIAYDTNGRIYKRQSINNATWGAWKNEAYVDDTVARSNTSGRANSAARADVGLTISIGGDANMALHWLDGNLDTPAWVWGNAEANNSDKGSHNAYVYSPARFHVAHAKEADHATQADNANTWKNLVNDKDTLDNSNTWIPVLQNSTMHHTVKGGANGLASLGSDTRLPANQAPSSTNSSLYIRNEINPGSYNEGIRIAKASNGWASFLLGVNSGTTTGAPSQNGGWGFYNDTSNNLIIGNSDSTIGKSSLVIAPNKAATFRGNITAPSVYTSNWFRSTGQTGWYNETYGGGIFMSDATWIRTYGGKKFYCSNEIRANSFSTETAFNGNLNGNATTATTATKVNATAPDGGTADLVFGTMAVNDYGRIRVGGKDDNGWLEIATADGGNEPIYARQYSGAYDWPNGRPGTVTNEAVLLDGSGNTKFPHNVTAPNFVGHLAGNADSATKANTATTATNANHANNADSATNSAALNAFASRPADANIQKGDGSVRYFLATRNMTKNRPMSEGPILHLAWDNNGGWDTQLAISNPGGDIQVRAQKAGTWGAWKTFLNEKNYTDYAPTKTGGGASGTWGINITGNANGAAACSNFENATANVYRNVWFSDSSNNAKPVYSSSIQYNPATATLKVANLAGNAASATNLDFSSGHIRAGGHDLSPTVNGDPGNMNISSWWGVSFTSDCGGTVPKGKTAVGIDCREGIVRARRFEGHFGGTADRANVAGVAESVAWGSITGKPASYPPSAHSHAYLPLSGGTQTGTISFAGIGDVGKSAGLSWGGSTDGASIYYQTTAADQGNLVLNTSDDANCYIRFAYNGAFKSYISTVDGVYHGNVAGNASSASSVPWSGVSGKPATYAPSAHSHSWQSTTGKPGGIVQVAGWDANTGTLTLKTCT